MSTSASPDYHGKASVLEALPDHPAIQALGETLIEDAKFDRGELTLTVDPPNIRKAVEAIKTFGYNYLEDVTAVDWLPAEPRFQISYHIVSHKLRDRVRLRSFVSSIDSSIDSITSVWPAADFYEREVFDLFGIRFNGHPNLRRIMMPDEFTDHPLRKDFPVEGYR